MLQRLRRAGPDRARIKNVIYVPAKLPVSAAGASYNLRS